MGALWPADTVVLIGAGTAVPVPGRGDRTYPFRAHSEYFYLTDRERPGGVLAFDPDAEAVERARRTLPDELADRVAYRVASGKEIEIEPHSFDLVVFSWSL